MKRIAWLTGISIFLAALASVAVAQDSSLGDLARQARKQKGQKPPAAKKYDNDNLPVDDKLSVVGQAPAETTDAAAPTTSGEPAPTGSDSATPAETKDAATGEGAAAPKATSADEKKPANDEQAQKQQMFKEWQTKIHEQQNQIDMLTREVDVANREYRLRAAAFYADAGNRLRNAGAWDKEDAQFKDQMAAKQQKLDDAKKQLEDLQEQARRAGVPSSMRD
ncbi:MAG TPA: hypothetical protein VLL05_10960 [Terriglobales bacterium]|nr:hypothetical protein [Terriglobales bacterium]